MILAVIFIVTMTVLVVVTMMLIITEIKTTTAIIINCEDEEWTLERRTLKGARPRFYYRLKLT